MRERPNGEFDLFLPPSLTPPTVPLTMVTGASSGLAVLLPCQTLIRPLHSSCPPERGDPARVGVPLLSLQFSSSHTALIFEWESSPHVAPAAALPLGDPSFIPHFGLFLFIIISRLGGQLRSENKDA